MQIHRHPLLPASPGTQRELLSLHFGRANGGPKVYIQASLHADELPGMLVAHHLRRRLLALEAAGELLGEVLLVPMANPIGISQRLLGRMVGRFALAEGENFNRHYADLGEQAARLLSEAHGKAQTPSLTQARVALRSAAQALPATSELASLRRTLLGLAVDADWVLDLHCDNESVIHLYAATPQWPQVEPLARSIGAQVSLLATDSGDAPFDEACSMVWSSLNRAWQAQGGAAEAWPLACVAVTVELRGVCDVSHAQAAADAEAIIAWLRHVGVAAGPAAPLPPLPRPATPLAGSLPLSAPAGGLLVHLVAVGSEVQEGDAVAEIIDVLGDQVHCLRAPCDGILYAREDARLVHAGMTVAKIAGRQALRTGKLLSA